jgi:hypothetical protein
LGLRRPEEDAKEVIEMESKQAEDEAMRLGLFHKQIVHYVGGNFAKAHGFRFWAPINSQTLLN